MFKGFKLKLSRNKSINSDISPNYILTYKTDHKNHCYRSHAIISAFVRNSDVIIELDWDLFDGTGSNMNYVKQLAENVKAFGLKSIYSIHPSTKASTILGFSVNSRKKKDVDSLVVYVPNSIWNQEQFKAILPPCGARYYIVNEGTEQNIVDDFGKMTEVEKVETFGTMIFDYAAFGRMGILSNSLSYEEIAGLLEV
ncbi:MAG TPA: hypothetical protein VHT34_13020 [Clostridia bacterium]|nr:hypothetical protein [Clostridia bacterium]